MRTYSHSSLGTFEQCKLKFKFNYIDKLEEDFENTIEAFMGSMVHETLEQLYKDVKHQKLTSLHELISFYNKTWQANWAEQGENIKIVRSDYAPENYRMMGEKFIVDYYVRHAPFNQDITIAMEQRVLIKIGPYTLQGYIDRLSCTGDGTYIIHDYKTSASLPTQQDVDEDRQLALYSIAIKEDYKDCKKVKLIWHYLAFDKDLESSRTDEQLEQLKSDIVKLIAQAETAKEYPPNKSALCNWCGFRSHCPEFKHLYKIGGDKPQQKLLPDDGQALVDEYAKLSDEKKNSEEKLEELRLAIIEYAKTEGITAVYGTSMKASLSSFPKLSFPKKGDISQRQFFETIKKLGLWEQLGTVDVYELAKLINNGDIHDDLLKLLQPYIKKDTTSTLRLSKREK